MSWTGEYWGKNGALAVAKQQFEASQKLRSDYVSYASVCYSAANRIFADLVHLRWSGFRRWYQGFQLAILAVHLIDEISLRFIRDECAFDERASIVDVVTTIYLRYGDLCGGRRKELIFKVIPEIYSVLRSCGINKKSRFYVKPHTQAFLRLHLIKLHKLKLKTTDLEFRKIRELISLASDNQPAQASRAARHLSEVMSRWRLRWKYRKLARTLALRAGASDQLAKL